MAKHITKFPVITVRIEPNAAGSHVIWRVTTEEVDGTEAHGLGQSPSDAMHDAAAFVEAMIQPRRGGLFKKAELKVVK